MIIWLIKLLVRLLNDDQRTKLVEVFPTYVREKVVETIYTRMDAEVYEHLERTTQQNCLVTSTTSDIEAGFKLGVSHVLTKIRTGYALPRSN